VATAQRPLGLDAALGASGEGFTRKTFATPAGSHQFTSEDRHRARHEQRPHDDDVDEDRRSEPEAEPLQADHRPRDEAHERSEHGSSRPRSARRLLAEVLLEDPLGTGGVRARSVKRFVSSSDRPDTATRETPRTAAQMATTAQR
jgi:hypothetical protein